MTNNLEILTQFLSRFDKLKVGDTLEKEKLDFSVFSPSRPYGRDLTHQRDRDIFGELSIWLTKEKSPAFKLGFS